MEKARYRVLSKVFIGPQGGMEVVNPNTIIQYDGVPSIHMEPLNEAAKTAFTAMRVASPYANRDPLARLPNTIDPKDALDRSRVGEALVVDRAGVPNWETASERARHGSFTKEPPDGFIQRQSPGQPNADPSQFVLAGQVFETHPGIPPGNPKVPPPTTTPIEAKGPASAPVDIHGVPVAHPDPNWQSTLDSNRHTAAPTPPKPLSPAPPLAKPPVPPPAKPLPKP